MSRADFVLVMLVAFGLGCAGMYYGYTGGTPWPVHSSSCPKPPPDESQR